VSPVSRRGLLRGALVKGALGAASTTALGRALSVPRAEAAQEENPLNAVLIVAPGIRADYVNEFDGEAPHDTPNLDRLAGQSLRFHRVWPDAVPALPVRRCLMTGMRAFPFRDWRRTPGLADAPGFCPIYDHQPLITEVTEQGGVPTAWVSDNPLLEGRRFGAVRRTAGLERGPEPPATIEGEVLPALSRQRRAVARTMRAGIELLPELRAGAPFFLALDPFDPQDAYYAPRTFVRPGAVEENGFELGNRFVEARFGDDEIGRVRDRYSEVVAAVDDGVGRVMSRLEDLDLLGSTVVFVVGDCGMALGEHGFISRGGPTSHRRSHEIVYMIRDPAGRRAGEESRYLASTRDVPTTLLSYLGLVAPGKMDGEDLTSLLDDEDTPERSHFTAAVGTDMLVANRRWLLLIDLVERKRRLFDDEEEDEESYVNVANDEPGVVQALSILIGQDAGGTVPDFGPEGSQRPEPEEDPKDKDGDGIPNDEDPVDNDDEADDDYKDRNYVPPGCVVCGTVLATGSRFCSSCGAAMVRKLVRDPGEPEHEAEEAAHEH
jgi:arylsulfatase A-like enzyme